MTNHDQAKLYADLCKLIGHERTIKVGDWVLIPTHPDMPTKSWLVVDKELWEESDRRDSGVDLWLQGHDGYVQPQLLLLIPTEADWREVIIKAREKIEGVIYDKSGPTALDALAALAGELKEELEVEDGLEDEDGS